MGKWHESAKDKIERRTEVDPETGCRVWTGWLTKNGYAQIWIGGRKQMLHRVAYEEFVGPIPDGLDIDHLCKNRACCEPTHLEPVTRSVNVQRGWDRGREWVNWRAS